MTLYKNRKLLLGEMTFSKDFVNDNRGDLYPVLDKSCDCCEKIECNCYILDCGSVERLLGQFFPYATYEMTAETLSGTSGFGFVLPDIKACITVKNHNLVFTCGERAEQIAIPSWLEEQWTMIVSCRPGAFDVYFKQNSMAQFWHTFYASEFRDSNVGSVFTNSHVSLRAEESAVISKVSFYIDNGISQADLRPIRYENGEVMMEQGKIYLSGSARLQEGGFQAIFSWVPGTAQFELTGALFFDAGDGRWAGDVASSILYHRAEKQWYLWVCSFSHGHILGHSQFEGDPRFGVNVIDIHLMKKSSDDAPISLWVGRQGDEDPDIVYDHKKKKWYMAICRSDPSIHHYRYVFFESDHPFEGYIFIGQGMNGSETGGSFVRVKGEQLFLCGNFIQQTSDYRIYSKDGMENAVFDYPDGGFRGWGTLMPVKMGSRTRYFWLTFDRHNGSTVNRWSYGNIYCFEAEI